MSRVVVLVLGALLFGGALACPKPGAVTHAVAPTPTWTPPAGGKCALERPTTEPLIVEWTSSARAKLEAVAHKGVVVVRYERCELEVLARCTVPVKYGWTPITRKDDRVHIRDADELWANVPLGAGSLEGKLARSGELSVHMTIVGRWEAERPLVRVDELQGECATATHVVSALVAGAFDFWAGGSAEVAGGASVAGYGAGGKSASKSELLARDGEVAACAKATGADTAPPDGCGALLRVELAKLGEAKSTSNTCSDKTTWDGSQCAALVVTNNLECPSGFALKDSACKPAAKDPSAPAALAPPCAYGDATGCTKRCEVDGDSSSCNDLALMLSRGDGIAQDDAKATTYFLRACDRGSAVACNNGGMRLEYGRGAAKDESAAANLYERACDANLAAACNNLARLLINGWGVPKDEGRAVELFRKACATGDAGACANLGWCYVRGRGIAADRAAGVGFLRKACKSGNSWSCDRMKDLKEPI